MRMRSEPIRFRVRNHHACSLCEKSRFARRGASLAHIDAVIGAGGCVSGAVRWLGDNLEAMGAVR